MSKKLLLLAAMALLIAGCSGEKAATTETAPVVVTVADFNAHAADYVEKAVTVSGTVDHVCKHGGKKMFIMGEDPSERLKIEVGEGIPAFDIALEGSRVKVTGVGKVFKMDAAYLDNWESEACSAEAKTITGTGEHHDEEGEHDEAAEAQAKIDAMRKQLAESGEEYIGFYHVEAASFEELH
jgi:hypothetical protein